MGLLAPTVTWHQQLHGPETEARSPKAACKTVYTDLIEHHVHSNQEGKDSNEPSLSSFILAESLKDHLKDLSRGGSNRPAVFSCVSLIQ